MKILLLSDSHYHSISSLDLSQFTHIIHCGDMSEDDQYYLDMNNGIYVNGNCDRFYSAEKIVNLGGLRCLITHSHAYHTKNGYDGLIARAHTLGVDYVFFGHTHSRTIFMDDRTTFINPGAFCEGQFAIIENNTLKFAEEDSGLAEGYYIKKSIFL
ncbi:MAG: YfcE family phosphodiesterase [Bacilli bacterium]|nr:YfcE family phosphodiesterase [Bacilli bacterium]